MSRKKKAPKVIISMATQESRYPAMLDTVRSLKEQYDELHIYANDFRLDMDDMDWPEVGKSIIVHNAPMGDLGDAAFMYQFTDERAPKDAICMIVGDDVIYPPDYVETMVRALKANDECAISLHGRLQFEPLESYYNSLEASQAFNGMRLIRVTQKVTVIGTAYVCWYSDLVEWSMEDFPQEWRSLNSRNMGDIWFSKKLNDLGIARKVIAHKADWVRSNHAIDASRSIGRRARKDDMVQTKLFNSVEWKL